MRREDVVAVFGVLLGLFLGACMAPKTPMAKYCCVRVFESSCLATAGEEVFNAEFDRTWKAIEDTGRELHLETGALDQSSGFISYTITDKDNDEHSTIHLNVLALPLGKDQTKVMVQALCRTPSAELDRSLPLSNGTLQNELLEKIDSKL